MELYSYFRSSAAYRLRIALNIKGIEHTLKPVNLLKGEHKSEAYRALQPQGLVPALQLDDGTTLGQTTAIVEYLEAEYPHTPLLPRDSVAAAVVRSWVNTIACDIHPLNNLRVLKYLAHELGVDETQKSAWYHHWISEGFAALESQVRAAPYCFGAEVTLADIYLIPQIYNALRFNTDMTAFPKLMAIDEACNKLAAFAEARPENQPDAN